MPGFLDIQCVLIKLTIYVPTKIFISRWHKSLISHHLQVLLYGVHPTPVRHCRRALLGNRPPTVTRRPVRSYVPPPSTGRHRRRLDVQRRHLVRADLRRLVRRRHRDAGWFADVTSMTLYSDTAADCGLHVNRVYAVVSSATSFYLPLVVMATVYGRIYRIARRQVREIYRLETSLGVFDEPLMSENLPSVEVRSACGTGVKDSKAIKTLGILMGMFCLCWCPFFVVYVIRPFCQSCVFPGPLVSAIT